MEVGSGIAPVAIGGLGGSGTRLVAHILKQLGFYLGDDLNGAYDNLWFTLLFKRTEVLSVAPKEFDELVSIFINGMVKKNIFTEDQINIIQTLASTGRPQHSMDWLRDRSVSLLATQNAFVSNGAWGWKEPNTHIIVNKLHESLPGMKYIHVVRNGLDMSYSSNQNQLMLWGHNFMGPNVHLSPYFSLKYWHLANKRILKLGKSMGTRFLFLNYDRLCLNPVNSLNILLNFLDANVSKTNFASLLNLVQPPTSIGRFKKYGINHFNPIDIEFAKSIGFDTSV